MIASFSKYKSLIALLVANTLPVFGVLFWGWDLFSMLILYWVESMMIGIWNVPKMIFASGSGTLLKRVMIRVYGMTGENKVTTGGRMAARLFLIPFFIFHYGMFMLGHLLFLLVFRELATNNILISLLSSRASSYSGTLTIDPYIETSFLIAVLSLFISHGISFFSNFIGKKEYLSVSMAQQMMQPYRRIVVMHITILIGVFASIFLGSSTGFLLVFWTIKVVVDVFAHLKERNRGNMNSPVVHVEMPLIMLMRKLVGIDFAVVGSLNLALQGVSEEVPHDIDIITDVHGMEKICTVFNVVPKTKGMFSEVKFILEETEVHALNDPQNEFRGKNFKDEMLFIPYGTLSIPCMSLQSELRYYEHAQREKDEVRIAHIKKKIEDKASGGGVI